MQYKKILATLFASALCVSTLMASEKFDARFNAYPTYSGSDLELTLTPDSTVFKLWSPAATQARVNLYNDGRTGAPYAVVPMALDPSTGVWSAALPGRLLGKFYTFQIEHGGKWLAETPGIWTRAVGTGGKRAAIIDLASTNPEGWEQDKRPKVDNFTDVVLYEMHHRDMSVHPSSGIVNKGKFLALTEQGTVSPQGLATGIDHLKELGITHVHILPSYDFNSVDEANLQTPQYNWGYDPQNYNAPEGSYSTNPADPAVRIREMKQMVKALHDAGIGVVMDVVYNHTAENDGSNFELTAPGYFHRHWEDGRYSDASGCGNETASDRPMMQDFIVESVKYWANEFHIDGFRFDLMAIHDTETMNRVAAELKAIDPSIFVYGEGWTAGDSPLPAERRALKANVAQMKDVAVFSDDIRDAVKGHYTDASDRGFATGKPGLEETVKIGIVAATDHPEVDYSKGTNAKAPYATSPEMIVNYVSCHDDLMLTDKLRHSLPQATDSARMRAARLAQTIVFTSQGTPFMFAGEEIFRDKKGVHNSYCSPDSINAIDWNLKAQNADQFRFYQNLIALRSAIPAFRMTSAKAIAENLHFQPIDSGKQPNLIYYVLTGDPNYKEIRVVFNGAEHPQTVKIPSGRWKVLAYDGEIYPDGRPEPMKGGKVSVPVTSALILAR